ncbi:metallophosphoesterase family protein [Methylotenera sp. N17]|uniref:metallophosphoesterase family protein n=1 Tax=Methylotenera sp. N17 TaxID=1502761 RepID=UPI0006474DE4|nr:metallophosphoesterase [Methylotenera sp. N17]
MYSILHITDLHRAISDPISNSELLSALICDQDSYQQEDPPIRPPDAIVVSGDIIQGVGLNTPNSEQELSSQYDVALDFLSDLAKRFLNGDRSKIIIVPGNHDIDWNVSFSSMELVDDSKYPKNLPSVLFEKDSPYRWDWKSRQLYQIKDQELYSQRLAAFWNFFKKFYSGINNMMRVEPWSSANLYSLDEGRIAIAAFNSCHGNDCFSFHGDIPREVIAQSHIDLKDLGPWRLRVAVWHHDVEGPPYRHDYMDKEIVRGMIGRGFRLGLYGHQHRVQITPQNVHLLTQETMVVASAGSLCAGLRELPMGAYRGYSIIEIHDDYSGARIHVREMRIANLFSRAILQDFNGRSYVDLKWTAPLDAAGRPENPAELKHLETIRNAEYAIKVESNPLKALRLLSAIDLKNDSFGRLLAVSAAVKYGDPTKLIEIIGNPQTIQELLFLFDAKLATNSCSEAGALITEYKDKLNLPESIMNELQTKVKLKRLVKL